MSDEESWAKKQIDDYVEGEDVPTIFGLAKLPNGKGQMFVIAEAAVDYSEMKAADGYARDFEECYREKYFEKGFSLDRHDSMVRISSNRAAAIVAFEPGGQHVLQAPSFFVEMPAEQAMYDDFVKKAEEARAWVLHIKTKTASYLYLIRYPGGELISAHKKDPIEMNLVDDKEEFDERQ